MVDKFVISLGELSPWLRACLGIGILLLCVVPLVYVVLDKLPAIIAIFK